MDIFIITGASKGLGFSLAKKISHRENTLVIGISRHKNKDLEKENLKYYEFDLTQLDKIEDLVKNILKFIDFKKAENIYLINNAGIIAPLKSLEEIKYNEAIKNFNLNFFSPLLLTSSILRELKNFKGKKFILNISSKSANYPIKNWVCYGLSKAAIDNLTKYIAVEYQKKSNITSISFHPPAMETSMREENLRSKGIFEIIWDFILVRILKRKKVYSPDEVADKILDFVLKKDFHSGVIVDLS